MIGFEVVEVDFGNWFSDLLPFFLFCLFFLFWLFAFDLIFWFDLIWFDFELLRKLEWRENALSIYWFCEFPCYRNADFNWFAWHRVGVTWQLRFLLGLMIFPRRKLKKILWHHLFQFLFCFVLFCFVYPKIREDWASVEECHTNQEIGWLKSFGHQHE